MANLDDHPLVNLGSEPISDDSPCGENARYESDFEQLEAELAKQESLTAATVDWARVVELATAILRQQSKDILVGSYLCYGLLVKEGYAGLAVGLKVLHDMVESHWECLFPPAKRMRARQTAFTWLAEKAALIVAEKVPAAAESEAAVTAANMLRQLDSTLVDKMGDQAPLLTDLSRPLKNYKQSAEAERAKAEQQASIPEPKPAVQAETLAPVTPPAASPPTSTPAAAAPDLSSASLASENDAKKGIRQIQAAVRDVAAFYLSPSMSDPRAYRMARIAVWMAVDKAPPDNEGVTQVIAPATERLQFFQTRLDKGDYTAVIPELEKTLARSPFWLDGHFFVVTALRHLGPEYANATNAVIRETGAFLSRLPELASLAFNDGTPFAADQTRLWLDAEVLTSSRGEPDRSTVAGQTAEAWNQAFAEASKAAAGGDSEKAIEVLNTGLQQAGSQREQVYWRCTLARFLIQVGRAADASALLEPIIAQLDGTQVGAWEPGILSQVYSLLYQSYQKQQTKKKEDPELKEKLENAYRKLCWFDPVNALSVKGG